MPYYFLNSIHIDVQSSLNIKHAILTPKLIQMNTVHMNLFSFLPWMAKKSSVTLTHISDHE